MGMKLIFLFRIMIRRTSAATRFESAVAGRDIVSFLFRSTFCIGDLVDKDVWIYISYGKWRSAVTFKLDLLVQPLLRFIIQRKQVSCNWTLEDLINQVS